MNNELLQQYIFWFIQSCWFGHGVVNGANREVLFEVP